MKKFFFYTPDGCNIGTISLQLLFAASICRATKKVLVLIESPQNVNHEIYKLCSTEFKIIYLPIGWVHHIYIFFGKLFNRFQKILVKLGLRPIKKIAGYQNEFIFGYKDYLYKYCEKQGFDWEWIDRYRTPLRLNERPLKYARAIREQMGIPENAWFVCFHAREPSYRSNLKYHFYRDVDIENYRDVMDEVVKEGGWVIRMGDPAMKKLSYAGSKIVDYVHTPFYSSLMDLYFISHCKLFFGCDSGPLELSQLLGTYTCQSNHTHFFSEFQEAAIFKHLYSKTENRILSIRERLELPMEILESLFTHAEGSQFIFIENTRSELLQFFKENRQFLKDESFDWNDELQSLFRIKKEKQLNRWKARHPMRHRSYTHFRIGRDYLEKCWEYTPYLQELTEDFQQRYLMNRE